MTVIFLTGASKGIGLALTIEELSTKTDTKIIAISRNPNESKELSDLVEKYKGRIVTLACDISDPIQVERTVQETKKISFVKENNGAIDMLINNAGNIAGGFDSPVESSLKDVQAALATNLLGTISITLGLLDLLRAGKAGEGGGKRIFIMSALGGTFAGPMSNISAASAFCVSKAALNMWGRKLALDLYEENFVVNLFHPGFVATQMGGSISPAESAKALVALFSALSKKETGKLYNYDGAVLPW